MTHGRADGERFDAMYRDTRLSYGLPSATPWDIGGPQPAVERLVALGAIGGSVLDPGTGPGHHAIHFALNGLRATGIDASPTAIERARRNAELAGVSVDFRVGDATTLDEFDNEFDTVVDCSFYHLLEGDESRQRTYLEGLRRATRPSARLYMFEFGPHNINGLRIPPAVPEENFRRLLPESGWAVTYLGATTNEVNACIESFEEAAEGNPDLSADLLAMVERLRVIESWLIDGRAHAPFWEVHATRVD